MAANEQVVAVECASPPATAAPPPPAAATESSPPSPPPPREAPASQAGAASALGWLNTIVRQRWRGEFSIEVEELTKEEAAQLQEEAGGGDAMKDVRFCATITGVECCVTLPDGRERPVRCADDGGGGGGGGEFVGYGRSKRAAQRAAGEAVRQWFQDRGGLWDPGAPKLPPPEVGGLTRAANRHRADPLLRNEANPIVYLDMTVVPGPLQRRDHQDGARQQEQQEHEQPQQQQQQLSSPAAHRVVIELLAHMEPAGAAAFLAMVRGGSSGGGNGESSSTSTSTNKNTAPEQHPAPLPPPPGAEPLPALAGTEFDAVVPTLLLASGGLPAGVASVALTPQQRAIVRARKEQEAEEAAAAAAEAKRAAREAAAEANGDTAEDSMPPPPPARQYTVRFDRPFLLAMPRVAVAPFVPDAATAAATAAAAAGIGCITLSSDAPAAAGAAAAAAVAPAAAAELQQPPPPKRFFLSLGLSHDLADEHVAIGHVLSGFGALREAALAHKDAAAAREAAERDGLPLPPLPAPCRIVAAGLLPCAAEAPPPRGEPPMLGGSPLWPEDLPPFTPPDMEAEARARHELASGMKAAGNAALAEGDAALAAARYRQGIRYLELLTFTSDSVGRAPARISYAASLPMWEAELALRLNLAHALTKLGRGDEAAESLRDVASRLPDNAKVWYRLGRAHASTGRRGLADAVDALTRAARLAPRDACVRSALSEAQSQLRAARAKTRDSVGSGLACALAGGSGNGDGGGDALYSDAEYVDGDWASSTGAKAPPPPPQVPEEVAAELVGRSLGLHAIAAAGPGGALPARVASDPAAALMAAWFEAR